MSSQLRNASGLRVLMTADTVGGVWQYSLDLAKELHFHGLEIILAVLGPGPSRDEQAAAERSGMMVRTTNLPLDWTARTQEELEEASQIIAGIAKNERVNIIHLNSPALAASASFCAPVVAVCHSCLATWWQAVRSGPPSAEFEWRINLVRKGYLASDVLIAPSAAFANMTALTYNLEKLPIVIHNGRCNYSIEQSYTGDLFAFTAGRLWDEGKNLAAIDRAAAHLSFPVLAAGPLQGPNGVHVRSQHLNVLGKIGETEIRKFLSAQPIFISPAYYEPFGLAVLEAAQAGCALVLSDISTLRELWDGAAVFVPPDEDNAIVEALEYLSQDSNARFRLGQLARERSKNYSVGMMAEHVLDVYRSLEPSTAVKPLTAGALA